MRHNSKAFRTFAMILCVLMVIAATQFSVFAAISAPIIIVEDGEYGKIISKKDYAIAPGVSESNIVYNDETGKNQQKGYVLEVDLKNPAVDLMASYYNLGTTIKSGDYRTQGLSAQAAFAESKGYNVVGGVNTSLRFGSPEPMGMLVINGEVLHDEIQSNCYFVVKKDGTCEIRSGDQPLVGNEQQAVCCFAQWLVRDGKQVRYGDGHAQGSRAPRTALGIKEDGTVVMFVCDGRNVPVAVGMTMDELAEAMYGLGCVTAINCDGGGSSTFISEREGTGELTIKNTPSDGTERETLHGLLVISKVEKTGIFDHAAVSPKNDYYSPASRITLNAKGVDYSGAASDSMPDTATWKLTDETFGTIEDASIDGNAATATFVSNGKQGTVGVELWDGENKIGETEFFVYAPDMLMFNSDNVNLIYEQVTDLGLVAKYNGNTVILNSNDIIWTAENSEIGTFDGLNLIVTNDYLASITTQITATYRGTELTVACTANVGMQPSVVLDGGDSDGLRYDHFGRRDNQNDTWQPNVFDGNIYDENMCDIISYHYMNSPTSSRGGMEYLELVSASDEEWTDIIRFGNNALKLNYDFTNTNGIEGACIGFSHDTILTGSPTAVGCWVYAPEGTANYWLRMAIKVGDPESAAYTYVNFTERCDTAIANSGGKDFGGINWTGWKYVEADLSQYAGQQINIIKGETIRVMDCFGAYGTTVNGVAGGQGSWLQDGTYVPRSERKGWILIDNLQFVYGANNEDITEPNISSIKYEDKSGALHELENGMTLV
ncbi:putative uncharacterized protein [Candidatus Apopatosoma intestinale]|nr:putative uncharacterized protein [Candidatus Apopatosoma intestinale]